MTYSCTFTDHLTDLSVVMQRFRDANIQLRNGKCKFGFYEALFSGHLLTTEGHRTLEANVLKIQRRARPENPKQLRSFWGLVNYYRDFIPALAETAAPFYKLTRKKFGSIWNEQCEESYQKLCLTLAQNPVTLAYPDWSKPFHLEVNASRCAIGGVLAQEDARGRLRPISFFSSTLDDTQQKFSVGEKEAWDIVAATRRFSKYLHAAESVIISSDQNPLVWLRQQRDPRGKFARWLLEMESLNYSVRYRRGSENLAADYLSRSASSFDLEVNDESENFERHVYRLWVPE